MISVVFATGVTSSPGDISGSAIAISIDASGIIITGVARWFASRKVRASPIEQDARLHATDAGEIEAAAFRRVGGERRPQLGIGRQHGFARQDAYHGVRLLVEFQSVVDAVRCAVEVQQGMATRNADVPADKRIEFRIGVNLGDIIIDENDIFGDGVNIAARLEALAEPGGICLGGSAHEQVRDKLDLAFEDLGEQQVKNITRPVRVYRVRALPSPTPSLVRRGPSARGVRRVRAAVRDCRSPTSRRLRSCRSRI